MKILLNVILSLVFFICASSCQMDGIEEDMVQFDRSFIPVLYFVYRGDLERSELALNMLEKKWQKFAIKYKKLDSSDDWQEQFRRMDGWLADCKLAIGAQDRFLLYNQLFNIRYELMSLREQEEIDYFLDYLWDFEASLNLTTEVALDPMLCLLEWDEFEFLVEELGMYWEILLDQPFDPLLFEMGQIEHNKLKTRQKEMTEAISGFSSAIANAESDDFKEAAKQLIPVYLQLLTSYGDFKVSESNYISKNQNEL